jgi:hypothetical protein
MLVLMLEDQANSAAANLRRKLVRRLAHGGSTSVRADRSRLHIPTDSRTSEHRAAL